MADSKISALPAASTPLAGTEVLPIVQSNSTLKVSIANLTAGRYFTGSSASIGNTTNPGANNLSVTGNVTAPNLQGPAFNVYSDTPQSISSSTFTKVTFAVEVFDTNNNFATSRFTPTVNGYYQINSAISSATSGSTTRVFASIFKNGGNVSSGGDCSFNCGSANVSSLVYLNGSTDYVEIYAYITGTTPSIFGAAGSPAYTNFSGSLLRSA